MVFDGGIHVFRVQFIRRQTRNRAQPVLAGLENFEFVLGQKPDDFLRTVNARAFCVPCLKPSHPVIPENLPDGTVGAVF